MTIGDCASAGPAKADAAIEIAAKISLRIDPPHDVFRRDGAPITHWLGRGLGKALLQCTKGTLRHSGRREGGDPESRDSGSGACAPSRNDATDCRHALHSRGLVRSESLSPSTEGAGNAGCFGHTRGPVYKSKKYTSIVTTGIASAPAFPARWFFDLFRALPGEPGFLATIACEIIPTSLTPASGCQDHTVSSPAFTCARLAQQKRPSHPAANTRDVREAPLLIGHGTREEVPVICPSSQAKLPATLWHDGQITSCAENHVK